MAKSGSTDSKRAGARSRGRPSRDVAAQIDQEILLAARKLFLSKGFERTSMALVTKAAGVSKTTLYARYVTKADLFRATLRFTVERMGARPLSSPERQTYDLVEGLQAFGYFALEVSLHPAWASYERIVFSEGERFPELGQALKERIEINVGYLSQFIRKCVERDGTAIRDPEGVGLHYILTLRGFFQAALAKGEYPSAGEIRSFVDRAVELLMTGRAAW